MNKPPSKTHRDMVEAAARLCQLLGLPRSTGQIYGLLFLSPKPLTLDEMAERLSISKASASTGTRQLVSWGAIRQLWVHGERRVHYEAVTDLGEVVRSSYADYIKPRIAMSQKRLEALQESLESEFKEGVITREEYDHCVGRIDLLVRLQKKLRTLLPLAEKLL